MGRSAVECSGSVGIRNDLFGLRWKNTKLVTKSMGSLGLVLIATEKSACRGESDS
jgi:hypothetical protein